MYKQTEPMNRKKHIVIVGGGVSGCMAAIRAESCGALVTIIEKNDQILKKVLSTGNGRCNLTNLSITSDDYYSDSTEDMEPEISSRFSIFSNQDVYSFFQSLGVFLHDRDGYVYPRTDQASTIVNALTDAIQDRKITVYPSCPVKGILCPTSLEEPMTVQVQNGEDISCDAVILATGGMVSDIYGCSGDAYPWLTNLGHHIISPIPSLCELQTNLPVLKSAQGVRTDCALTCFVDDQDVAFERGELQCKADALSGIVVFQLAHPAIRALKEHRNVRISIDFLPEFSKEQWESEVTRRCHSLQENMLLSRIFTGLVPSKIGNMILAQNGLQAEMKCKRIDKTVMKSLLADLRCFEVPITGHASFDKAQVTSGGVSMKEVKKTGASSRNPRLYLVGELLDVDGKCGGYNLQWAMSTGWTAGEAAAKSGRKDFLDA